MNTHICGAICGDRMEETHRRPDGERWCFVCRKRTAFDYVVMMPVIDRENPSYYGPTSSIECATCHTDDSDLFPGREREWVDA
jgi:hypothetical protein